MPDALVDLHMHTNFSSDGDHPPLEILEMARSCGLAAISIADHDTTKGSMSSLRLSPDFGVEIIPNVEVTTYLDGRELHILAFFVDYDADLLQQSLAAIRDGEELRMAAATQELQRLGIDVTYEEVKILAPLAPPKCSIIIKAAIENGRNADKPILEPYLRGDRADQPLHNFFLDYMRAGKSAYVPPISTYSSIDAVQMIRSCKGIPVIAHPAGSLRLPAGFDVIARLQEEGLLGIEAYSSYHSAEEESDLVRFAEAQNLLVTAGSDFHGLTVKPNIRMGHLRSNPYSLVTALRECHAKL